MLYCRTRYGERCLYIPNGQAWVGKTLREYIVDKIHSKGHFSAERNLHYATQFVYWPEMRKEFREYIQQCET
jgi:hypothetical protein